MKIIFFGTPEFVLPVLEMLNKQYEVAAVVTNPDQKIGRKQVLTPSPVKIFAQKNNIEVLTPEKLNEQFKKNIQLLQPDLFIVAAYGKIIPEALLQIPKWKAINIHPSKLPKYRGPSPLQSLILNGETHNHTSFMLMDAQMDHGPILSTLPFVIKGNDTFQTLSTRVFQEAAEELPIVLGKYIKGKIQATMQNDTQSAYCQRISRQSGYIDLSSPPEKEVFDRMIRAYYPWPGVWTKWEGKIIKFFPDQKIQLEGKNIVNYQTFVSGYPEIKPLLDRLLSEEREQL